MRYFLLLAFSLFALSTSGLACDLFLDSPAPLGLKIGAVTLSQVRARYGCKLYQESPLGKGVCILEGVNLPGLRQAEAVFDKNGYLVGVRMLFLKLKDGGQFNTLLWVLNRKYFPLRVDLVGGDKEAEFEKGEVLITLRSPRLSPLVKLTYFQRKYLLKIPPFEPEELSPEQVKELLNGL